VQGGRSDSDGYLDKRNENDLNHTRHLGTGTYRGGRESDQAGAGIGQGGEEVGQGGREEEVIQPAEGKGVMRPT